MAKKKTKTGAILATVHETRYGTIRYVVRRDPESTYNSRYIIEKLEHDSINNERWVEIAKYHMESCDVPSNASIEHVLLQALMGFMAG